MPRSIGMIFVSAIFIAVTFPWMAYADLEHVAYSKLFPWSSSMPSSQYKDKIQLRLVKKNWMPAGIEVKANAGVLDSFPGSVDRAYEVFRSETPYQFHDLPLARAGELLSDQYGYQPDLPTIMVIHTISGDADNYFIKNVVAALAMRNMVRYYNVFTVNMPDLQQTMEQTVVRSAYGMDANYFGIGTEIASFFVSAIKNNLMTADQINLIGFCYSSQLSGYIARHIHRNNGGKKIHTILALDPYSMGLSSWRHELLSADDAQVVHAYHTNSLVFGTLFRRATADFSFNSGNFQRGCFTSSNYMCSHRRSVLVFWYVILFKDLFYARHCRTFAMFFLCGCQNNPLVGLSYPPINNAQGEFYLKTTSHRPYGYGEPGADCHAKPVDSVLSSVINEFDFTEGKSF